MPDLFDDSIPVPEAVRMLEALARVVEEPYQRAIAVVLAHHADVVKTGRDMREAQNRYFKSKADLPQCKALEAKFDRLVKE